MSNSNGVAAAEATAAELGTKKVWATLITRNSYLPGTLTIDYALKAVASKYPLIALYTDALPDDGRHALELRGIPTRKIEALFPSSRRDFTNEPRFYDTWSKLAPFSLTDFERVVLIDSDMLVLKNMDELMDLPLDPPEMKGEGDRVFAASHACVCNPMKKPHYPANWTPEHCGFAWQHGDPEAAQVQGSSNKSSHGQLNSGLVVIVPSDAAYRKVIDKLTDEEAVEKYDFPDQALMSDVFSGRWVTLPYVYNALKSMRMKGVHDAIWRDDRVKNVHYIFSPKPWEEPREEASEIALWWHDAADKRHKQESARGINDGY